MKMIIKKAHNLRISYVLCNALMLFITMLFFENNPALGSLLYSIDIDTDQLVTIDSDSAEISVIGLLGQH